MGVRGAVLVLGRGGAGARCWGRGGGEAGREIVEQHITYMLVVLGVQVRSLDDMI